MGSSQSTPMKNPRISHHLLNNESPMTQKVSQAAVSHPEGTNTDTRRDNTLIELGEAVPQVPAQFFVGDKGILPPLPFTLPPSSKGVPQSVLAEVIRDLKEKEVLLPSSVSVPSRWECFKEGNPSAYIDKEDRVFADIQIISNAIRQSLDAVMEANNQPIREPTVVFKCNPNQVLASVSRDNKTRPDCYAVLNSTPAPGISHTDAEGTPYWLSIGVPGEFKKKHEDRVQNWTQVLWSLTYMMQEDPRRRFVFAFTIEDALMRIWIASRSDVLVSMPFDFNDRYDYMTEFFLRLMYADEEQLGWDTTMERLPRVGSTGPFQYKMNCAGVMYRTVRLISDIGTEALRGRGTRVWEVRELNEDGSDGDPKSFVLKDSWVDADRDREAKILDNVRKAAEEHGFLDGFERHFMHVRRSSDVYIGKDPVKDHTHDLILCGRSRTEGGEDPLRVLRRNRRVIDKQQAPQEPEEPEKNKKSKKSKKKAAEKEAAKKGAKGAQKRPADVVEKVLQYAPKVHHRIVFEELGRTIVEVNTLSDALKVLADAVTALRILHESGWVHRDVSTGNILVVDGVGKLSDLEYAKAQNDVTVHGVRTGTPCFMATEVERQKYLYVTLRRSPTPPPAAIEDSDDEEEEHKDGQEDGGNSSDENNEDDEDRSSSVPPSSNSELSTSNDLDESESETSTTQRSDPTIHSLATPSAAPADGSNPPPFNPLNFRHNPLHDLESAFWVEAWLLVCSKFVKQDKKSKKKWDSYMVHHGTAASKLFDNYHDRQEVINDETTFKLNFKELLPGVAFVCSHLEVFRRRLRERYISAYEERQASREQPPFAGIAHGLHGQLLNQIDVGVAELLRKGDLQIEVRTRVEDNEDVALPMAKPLGPSGGSSTRRTSEAAEMESVQRKRQKTNNGKAVSLPAAPSSRMTQMQRLPIARPSRMTRSQTKKLTSGQN